MLKKAENILPSAVQLLDLPNTNEQLTGLVSEHILSLRELYSDYPV